MLKKIKKFLTDSSSKSSQSLKNGMESNEAIILSYKILRNNGSIPANEPNYELAKKVFLDFNNFNQRNLDNNLLMYLGYIPKSLLPYPKNYIKCSYYIFLEKLQKEGNIALRDCVEVVGNSLFYDYPDYDKYKANLQNKKWFDNEPQLKELNCRDGFKLLYGVYEVSEEDYYSSPSSVDVSDDKLINDFGVLPAIEEDIDLDSFKPEDKKE